MTLGHEQNSLLGSATSRTKSSQMGDRSQGSIPAGALADSSDLMEFYGVASGVVNECLAVWADRDGIADL
jgi:hypothetical protein